MRTKKVPISLPEYLYKESEMAIKAGLFEDLSDLVRAGIRKELRDMNFFFEPELRSWEEGVNMLREKISEKRNRGDGRKTEKETIEDLRKVRREIWEERYRQKYVSRS